MRYLYVFRHGQTEWNRKGYIQGHSDICLNESGVEQAQKLQAVVTDLGIEKIYSSDLQRALQTSRLVNKSIRVNIKSSPLFREANLGQAEGKSLLWVQDNFGELFWDTRNQSKENFWDFSYPGGESRGELINRFREGISEIQEKCAAVSTHGGVLRLYLLSLMQEFNIEVYEAPIPNCAMYRVCFSEKVEILKVN